LRVDQLIKIHLFPEEDRAEIEFRVSEPSLYLDQCAIRELSRNEPERERFFQVFRDKRATLYFSGLNLLEIVGMDVQSHKYGQVRDFVQSVGEDFAIMEVVPDIVIAIEKGALQSGHPPALDASLVKQLLIGHKQSEPVTFANLLLRLEGDPEELIKLRQKKEEFKARMKDVVDQRRKLVKSNGTVKIRVASRAWEIPTHGPPTEFIYKRLMNYILVTPNEEFVGNDAVDLYHSVVSTAYCHFVVLDKKWGNRLRKLPMPPAAAHVYPITELSKFVSDLAIWSSI